MPPTTRAHARGAARDAILDAARHVFGRDGYHGASLRQIAAEAQVSEALLYRYFPGKDRLFEAAVTEPFGDFVDAFIADWEDLGATVPNDEMVTMFVLRLHAFATAQRDVLYALTTVGPGAAPVLSDGIRRLAAYTSRQAEQRGIADVDLEMAVANTVGVVLAAVLFRDLLLARDHDPQRALTELAKYAAAGVQQTHRRS